MNCMLKKNKMILLILIALIIIAGLITLFVAGFEKTFEYQAGTRIEVYIPQGYERQNIIDIAKESFNGKPFGIEKIEKLNQVVGIKIKEYSEEEIKGFKTKISDKYEISEDKLEVHEIAIPAIRIRNAVEPYILPIVLVTVISSIYVLFKNLKSENKWKVVIKTIAKLAIIIAVYFSAILILRLPFGTSTMPLALALYIVTIMLVTKSTK